MTAPEIIKLVVRGDPKPQPRNRNRRGGQGRQYDPGTAMGWRERFWLQTREAVPTEPWTGPIGISLAFYFARPQRLLRKKDPDGVIACDGVADNDNLEKAVWDEMQNMGFFENDKQICHNETRKWYCARKLGHTLPGCEVILWKVNST